MTYKKQKAIRSNKKCYYDLMTDLGLITRFSYTNTAVLN